MNAVRSRLSFSISLAAIGLLHFSASASLATLTYTIDVPLTIAQNTSSIGTGQVLGKQYSYAEVSLGGSFNVPTLDPNYFSLSEVSFGLTVKLVDGAWTSDLAYIQGQITQIGITVSVPAVRGSSGSSLYSLGAVVPHDLPPPVSSFTDFTTADNQQPNGDAEFPAREFLKGSSAEQDGAVPLQVTDRVHVGAVDASAPFTSAPHVLAYSSWPILEVTYQFDPLVNEFAAHLPPQPQLQDGSLVYYSAGAEGTVPVGLVPTYVTGLVGDGNLDGIVSLTDLTLIASHWHDQGSGIPGDVNGDGVVNLTDLTEVASNWLATKNSTQLSARTVPEPSTFALAALGGLALLALRRRR